LLIADDAGNTVWRVAAADGSITPAPIGTDRLTTMVTETPQPEGSVTTLPTEAEPPSTDASVFSPSDLGTPDEPPQTNIAPAVSPEDGQ
jgi:hypothetical protein